MRTARCGARRRVTRARRAGNGCEETRAPAPSRQDAVSRSTNSLRTEPHCGEGMGPTAVAPRPMSMPSARTRHDAHALPAARPGLGATDLRRERALTVVGLAVTVGAALLAGLDVATVLASRINGHDLIGTIVQVFFLGVV